MRYVRGYIQQHPEAFESLIQVYTVFADKRWTFQDLEARGIDFPYRLIPSMRISGVVERVPGPGPGSGPSPVPGGGKYYKLSSKALKVLAQEDAAKEV